MQLFALVGDVAPAGTGLVLAEAAELSSGRQRFSDPQIIPGFPQKSSEKTLEIAA
jgi:hypothetical protein